MEITEMRVRLTMTDPVLGMAPQDAKLYETYIASKSPDAETIEEEIERVGAADVAQKGMTVFRLLRQPPPEGLPSSHRIFCNCSFRFPEPSFRPHIRDSLPHLLPSTI